MANQLWLEGEEARNEGVVLGMPLTHSPMFTSVKVWPTQPSDPAKRMWLVEMTSRVRMLHGTVQCCQTVLAWPHPQHKSVNPMTALAFFIPRKWGKNGWP